MKITTGEISKPGKKHSPSLIKRYTKPAEGVLKRLLAKEAGRDWGSLPTANIRYMSVLQTVFLCMSSTCPLKRNMDLYPSSWREEDKENKKSLLDHRTFLCKANSSPVYPASKLLSFAKCFPRRSQHDGEKKEPQDLRIRVISKTVGNHSPASSPWSPLLTHTVRAPFVVPFNSHLHHRWELLQIHFIEAFIEEIPAKPLLIILEEDLPEIKGQKSAIQQYLWGVINMELLHPS